MRAHEIILEYSQVDMAWFGNSKVVDAQGNPLICYHATNHHNEISSFRPLTHFGTSKAAHQRLSFRNKEWNNDRRHDGIIYPVYLKIVNPLRVTDGEASDEAAFLNGVLLGHHPEIDSSDARHLGCVAACEQAGYDGLVYKNRMEDRGKDSWVTFRPSQVRSAI